nr:carboxypeptidase regulatory-like domain-containing protein [Acidobacteriota bacterium]
MLAGYISDERYVAIPDALVEFQGEGLEEPVVVRSTPRGEIYAPIPPGRYHVTLSKPGYGAKNVEVRVEPGNPYQFRLLMDNLLGYMWPVWAKAGSRSELRVHSAEEYQLSLWRYGIRKEPVHL